MRSASHALPLQIRQLLYAGLPGKPGAPLLVPLVREFKVPNEDWEKWDATGREGKAPKKQRAIELRGIVSPPIPPTVFTTSGLPSTSALALRALVGKPGTATQLIKRYEEAQQSTAADAGAALKSVEADAKTRLGSVFSSFGGGLDGLKAGAAIDALCEASAVETLLTGFIKPLQARRDATGDACAPAECMPCLLCVAGQQPARARGPRALLAQHQHRNRPAFRTPAQPAESARSGEGPVRHSQGVHRGAGQVAHRGRLRTAGAASPGESPACACRLSARRTPC